MIDLFKPVQRTITTCTFRCDNVRELYAQLHASGPAGALRWDRRSLIDWRHYWMDIHFKPACRSGCSTVLDDEFGPKQRSRLHLQDDLLELFDATTKAPPATAWRLRLLPVARIDEDDREPVVYTYGRGPGAWPRRARRCVLRERRASSPASNVMLMSGGPSRSGASATSPSLKAGATARCRSTRSCPSTEVVNLAKVSRSRAPVASKIVSEQGCAARRTCCCQCATKRREPRGL